MIEIISIQKNWVLMLTLHSFRMTATMMIILQLYLSSETEKENPMSVISPIIAVAPVPVEWVTPDSQMTPSSKTDTIHSTIINDNILRIYIPKWKMLLLIQWILQYSTFKQFLLLQWLHLHSHNHNDVQS